MIYLDNAATTLYKPEPVRRAVYEAMGTVGNSGRGAWGPALSASRLVYSVREKAAEFFGAWGGESVAFTSNATEALNIAIEGLVKKGDHVITTQVEHNSVLRPLYRKEKEGAELTILPADEKGNFSLADMEKAVRQNTTAVICTHASNVTGNLFPAEEIGNLCRRYGLLFILDASQSAGEAFIDMQSMHIDVLCFTGHKGLMGPQGTGGICVDPQVKIPPFKTGGSGILSFDREHPDCMPEALEAGTLNIHGLAGLGAAFDYLRETGLEQIIEHEKRLAVAAMAVLLIVLFFVLICVGRYPISPLQAFEIIGKALLGNQEGMDIYESSVILSIRLPRILMGILVAGLLFFTARYFLHAREWVTFQGSPHVYSGSNLSSGRVTDRSGVLLLDSTGESRVYAEDETIRKATLHLLGDRYGYISAPILTEYADKLVGFSIVNGLYGAKQASNTAVLSISAQVQKVALEALSGYHGTVGVYNYKTGEILCAVTSPRSALAWGALWMR